MKILISVSTRRVWMVDGEGNRIQLDRVRNMQTVDVTNKLGKEFRCTFALGEIRTTNYELVP